MRITDKVTIQYLRRNKVRTLVTVIGIVMAMAMLTCVVIGVNSAIVYLRDCTIADEGRFDGVYYDVEPEELNQLMSQNVITGYSYWQAVSFGTYNKETITVANLDEDINQYIPFDIAEGTMPTSPDEVAVTASFLYNNDVEIGDEITVKGNTYTITGVYVLMAVDTTDVIFTVGIEGNGPLTVFFTVDDPANYYSYVSTGKLLNVNNLDAHTNLLTYYGAIQNDSSK